MHIDFELLEGLDEDSPVTTGFCAYEQGWLQVAHAALPLIGYSIIVDIRSNLHPVCPAPWPSPWSQNPTNIIEAC